MGNTAWDCPECGHSNEGLSVCEVCGLAQRYVLDPPLDLPRQPRLRELPAFYQGLLWSVLAAVGTVLLLIPGWRETLQLSRWFVLLELLSTSLAAASSFSAAWWTRWFNTMSLTAPSPVKTGETFDAVLTLVPYDTLNHVTVNIRLVDNFYQRSGDTGVLTRTSTLDRQTLLRDTSLTGRRSRSLSAGFLAPFPTTPHTDVLAEINASVLGLLAWIVPAFAWSAQNLREHGGYFVEANVRVGWLRRTFKRRVIAYSLGDELRMG